MSYWFTPIALFVGRYIIINIVPYLGPIKASRYKLISLSLPKVSCSNRIMMILQNSKFNRVIIRDINKIIRVYNIIN